MKKSQIILNQASTLFLRLAIFVIGAIVLALCAFALPAIWQAVPREFEDYSLGFAIRAILLAFYIGAAPFFVALAQSLLLLNYIDRNKAFSSLSTLALKRISY